VTIFNLDLACGGPDNSATNPITAGRSGSQGVFAHQFRLAGPEPISTWVFPTVINHSYAVQYTTKFDERELEHLDDYQWHRSQCCRAGFIDRCSEPILSDINPNNNARHVRLKIEIQKSVEPALFSGSTDCFHNKYVIRQALRSVGEKTHNLTEGRTDRDQTV